ncbi:unnamed protein product [Meganyctiphanes norvegica]|uniref:Gustatory receptor n=1 Tax=Meganyctiphanes norvegica TaxID=48144 RepID=A0AAV2RBV4_MEGNR
MTTSNRTSEYKQFDQEYCNTENTVSEPDLVSKNEIKFANFRRLGLFLFIWKDGKYKPNERKLLLYYVIWYVIIAAGFGLAYLFKEICKGDDYVDNIDDRIEASFIGVLLGIIPAFWIYLLREYNANFPHILTIINKLEKTEIYKKLEYSTKENAHISYMEGWLEGAYNDKDDKENEETRDVVKNRNWFVTYGPHLGFGLSFCVCTVLIAITFVEGVSKLLWDQPANTLKHMKKEFPHFFMTVVYPIPYFISIWFCIFFLEWQRKIHESVRYLIRRIKNVYDNNSTENPRLSAEHKKDLENITYTMNLVQKVFILLNKMIFKKTIVIDFILFIILGIFCCWKILGNPAHFPYVFPASLVIGHIFFACSWSNSLMKEYNETIEVLNDMHEEDVQNLRRELKKCPPQVLAFGEFRVNFSMVTAVIAFIISCIGIPEDVWPEQNQYCYQFNHGDGVWNRNDTICIKKQSNYQ